MASFWAVVAGISFSGCRILMQNLKLNTIEVTLVGAFVQIVLSGLFVSFFQCHRLWSAPPAGTNLRPIGKKILWICTLEHFFMFIYC